MRQRKVKNLEEKLSAFESYIIEKDDLSKGEKTLDMSIFKDYDSFFLELGCGKGDFATTLAKENPRSMVIACEGHRSVALMAISKAAGSKLENIRFLLGYINDLGEIFEEESLDGIFLNFSDPWPKERHAKRRLTTAKRLGEYFRTLRPNGFVAFKTDNDGLFDFTIGEIESLGIEPIAMTRDLHKSKWAKGNIQTEYERKFSSQGKKINYVKIVKE